MKKKKFKIALLSNGINLLIDNIMASSRFDFYCLDFAWGKNKFPNPYNLESLDEADYIMIDTSINSFIQRTNLENDIEKIFSKLRAKSKKGLIGVEGKDWFHLAQKPQIYYELDIVLKNGGIYKDKSQYNSYSGSCSTNRNWTDCGTRSPIQYDQEILDKLKPSIPCFVSIDPFFRRNARRVIPHIKTINRIVKNTQEIFLQNIINHKSKIVSQNSDYYYRGSITHLQRLELGEILKDIKHNGFYKLIFGSDEYMWGSLYGRDKIPDEYKAKLKRKAKTLNILGESINKRKLVNEMLLSGVILSPTGFGELCFRHAEAWQLNRTLLCQDLSHVEMLFPVVNEDNAVFCKSDFSNIESKLKDLTDDGYRNEIAQRGKNKWNKWISDPNQIIYEGFEKYLIN